jgi:hypothetical protein
MNMIGWTAVGIRLLALWLAVDILIGFPAFVANWASTAEIDFAEQAGLMAASFRANLIAQLTAAAVAAFLWFQSETIARRVTRNVPAPTDQKASVAPLDLQRAVLVGVGIYLVAYAVPDLADLAVGYYSVPEGFQTTTHYMGNMKARAIGVAIQIAIGLALVLGSEGISNLIDRVRASRVPA